MPVKRYAVKLSEVERARLEKFTSSTSKTNTLQSKTRAKIILHLGENGGKPLTPEQTAKKCKTHQENVYKIRKQFLTEGIDRILNRKKRLTPPVTPKVTGEVEAHIIATACSSPPEGKAVWTMQMIADKIVLDGVAESISDETVRRVLKNRTQAALKGSMVYSER